MDIEDHLFRYFGLTDLSRLNEAARESGVERMLVDFGLTSDPANRFALWSLLYMFDAAPDLDVAFQDPEDREAARNFMDILAKAEDAGK